MEFQATNAASLSPRQRAAMAHIARFLNEENERDQQWGVQPEDVKMVEIAPGLHSVVFQFDLAGCREDSMLRALYDGHWHFFVGPRGGIRVKAAPKSFAQFYGKDVFGMRWEVKKHG